MKNFIDLRSDTVTKPCAEMREAMMNAEVGDDVYGEDPSIIELENLGASLLGKESALFVPSGVMSNQLAIGTLCDAGDEMITHRNNHVVKWEGGAPARLWGVSVKTCTSGDGIIRASELEQMINDPFDVHYNRTRLVSLENSLNRCGGKVYPLDEIKKIHSFAQSSKLLMHLDGARLFNSVVASNSKASKIASYFDTISICLSKGLGAPVGSLFVSSKDSVDKARKLRKILGGGMRQAGYLAAAGSFALKNNIERLTTDHHHAKLLAEAALSSGAFELEFESVDTNIVWLKLVKGDDQTIAQKLKEQGILCTARGGVIRFVTHLGLSESDISKACEIIKSACSQ
ncbi:MAG: aminotransferase class I/II-fold pyridoxal phosphate-dependent enzyme [Bacteriovoracaceae bacterium]|nr:aminotransferase class I/II-fold pyridoxal phosphate-dependent enzyme [Bacteriovoracaceae bacterium]